MAKNAKNPKQKPKKPYSAFPLTPHNSGTWCKKIHGHIHHFGPWRDPDAAMQRYLAVSASLHAGAKLRIDTEGATIREIANRFMNAKRIERDAGLITPGWYGAYDDVLLRFMRHVGPTLPVASLTPDHFAMFRDATRDHGLDRAVQCVRAWMHYATENDWCQPVRFGSNFRKSPRAQHRAARRVLLFTPAECRKMLDRAKGQIHAMILLALNGGMGQMDLATLTVADVDLLRRLIDYRRRKTHVARTVPLWPRTKKTLTNMVKGKSPVDLIFLTRHKNPWVRVATSRKGRVSTIDSLSQQFGELLAECKIWKRNAAGHPISDGRNFYTLRRTFRTIADEQGDQRAIALIMGHAAPANDMGAVYVQRIDRKRLEAVVKHVERAIFKK